jgi:O-antigen/teichoic acid export membrane protein
MIIGSVVFARLYSPSAFGTLAYVSGFASIIAIVSGLRFDYIVFSKKEREKSLYNIISFLIMFFFHLVLACITVGIDLLSDLISDKIYWLVFFSFSSSVFYLSTQLLISIGEYSFFSKIRIFQALLQLGTGFLFFYLNPNIGLILAYSISQLVIGILVYYFNFNSLFNLRIEEIKNCFLVNFKNAFYNSVIILIQYSTPFAPILIGEYFYHTNDVGAFFLLSSAICAPLAIFRRSLVNLFNGELTSPKKARILIGRMTNKFLILFGIILLLLSGIVIILIFSEEIVLLVFGKQWVVYSSFMLPLFVFFYLDMIFQPFTTLLPLWGRQNYSMFLESLRFGLVYLLLPLLAFWLSFSYLGLLIGYFFLSTIIYILTIFKVFKYIIPPLKIN